MFENSDKTNETSETSQHTVTSETTEASETSDTGTIVGREVEVDMRPKSTSSALGELESELGYDDTINSVNVLKALTGKSLMEDSVFKDYFQDDSIQIEEDRNLCETETEKNPRKSTEQNSDPDKLDYIIQMMEEMKTERDTEK